MRRRRSRTPWPFASYNGFKELPQRPTVFFAADFQQLNPLGSSAAMRAFITIMTVIPLHTIHRTNDDRLLGFLRQVRVKQPAKSVIREFFAGRTWDTISLETAVSTAMSISRRMGEPFHWLTVTNKGADEVNAACLSACGLDKPEHVSPLYGDPKVVSGKDPLFIAPGVVVRPTRNPDEERGFVNGATGVIETVLQDRYIFTV